MSVKEPCLLSPGLGAKLVQDISSVVSVASSSYIVRFFYSPDPLYLTGLVKGTSTSSGRKVRKKWLQFADHTIGRTHHCATGLPCINSFKPPRILSDMVSPSF